MSGMIDPVFLDQATKTLRFNLESARVTHCDQEAVTLAIAAQQLGQTREQQLIKKLIETPFNNAIARDFQQPINYTNMRVIGQDWADTEDTPLKAGEAWNRLNRASNTGIKYALDEKGHPINPFYDYGVKGRGVVGRYGPNHAVDMAPCRMMRNKDGELSLHVLGIIRNDNNLPSLCGGFTTFKRNVKGHYPYSKQVFFQSQASEFFEEMVSGSVELLPNYAVGLQDEIALAIKQREMIEKQSLSHKQKKIIAHELTTHRKVKQVEKEDPQFLQNIYNCFANAHECYAGPVFSSARNTNTSWMETRLSWFMLDEETWETMKGGKPYEFSAGDDAQDVLWHEITPDLINGSGSHGPLFCAVFSDRLAQSQNDPPEIRNALKKQAITLTAKIAKPSSKPEVLRV